MDLTAKTYPPTDLLMRPLLFPTDLFAYLAEAFGSAATTNPPALRRDAVGLSRIPQAHFQRIHPYALSQHVYHRLEREMALRTTEPSVGTHRNRVCINSLTLGSDVVYSIAPVVLVTVLLMLELPGAWLTMGWSMEAVVIMVLGAFVSERYRVLGNFFACIVLGKLLILDAFVLRRYSSGLAPGELLLSAFVPAIIFLSTATALAAARPTKIAEDAVKERQDWGDNTLWRFLEKEQVSYYTGPTWRIYLLVSVIVTCIYPALELQNELISIAWTLEAVVILLLGFSYKSGYVRTIGIGLFIITILKVFTLDVSKLETIYRILSFLILGFILLVVSYLYSKYRDKLK